MDEAQAFQEEFVQSCRYRMEESLRMVRIAMESLTEEQVWQRPNTSLNSVGNLILHLCGNMTQYGLASLNNDPDDRNRDLEFSTIGGLSKSELLEKLTITVAKVINTFQSVTRERLLAYRQVQGFSFSGIGNMIHVVEHFSYHTGQIAFWVKQLHNKPLGFYDGADLNVKNDA
ncbi:MAG: DinB family protein [Bacteroidota bacterium]